MDDIYNPGFSNPIIVEDVYEDEGEAPTNVPGAAYVYQPIPEPSLDRSSPYIYTPYNVTPYSSVPAYWSNDPYASSWLYGSNYYSPYFYSSFGFGFSNYYGSGYGFYNPYNPYNPYGYGSGISDCPSNGGSSTQFISKRFDWNSNTSEQNFEYITNASSSKADRTNTGTRKSSSRKSRFTNSRSSSETKNNGFWKDNSSSTKSSTYSRGSSRSNSSSGSRSSGSSRSSSGSYSGKRIR